MSIATQISRLNNNIDNLKTTKQSIKEAVNEDFNIIADEQIENYADLVEKGFELYKDYIPPTKTEQATEITVTDAMKYSKNKLDIFGNLNQETRSGKNKFNAKEKLNASTTKNNITYTKNADNTFDIIGTASAKTTINIATVIDLIQKAKSYYLYSSKKYNLTTFNLSVVIRYVDNDVQYIRANNSIVTTLKDKEIKFATLNFHAAEGITVNASNVKIMLVESDTVDNEFEEYEAMPSLDYPSMPVVATGVQTIKKIGKNFLPNRNVTTTKNGLTATYNTDGTIIINGTSTSQTIFPINTISSNIQITEKLLPNTYTLSAGVECNYQTYFIQGIYIKNNKKIYLSTTLKENTFTIEKNTLFGAAIIVRENITCNNVIFKPMIEIGNKTTDYEPYKEEVFELDLADTELCKITDSKGNVVAQDRAVYRLQEDGTYKWQWEKNVYKIVFTGNELWLSTTAYKGFNRFRFDVNNENLLLDTATSVFGLNSHFTQRIYQPHGGYEYLYVQTTKTGGSIYIQLKDIKTVEDLKALLIEQYNNGSPITVYYVGLKSSYEDCKVEQSETLDKLYKLSLQQGTNNIIVESENGVTLELSLTYIQNLLSKAENTEITDTDVGNIEET